MTACFTTGLAITPASIVTPCTSAKVWGAHPNPPELQLWRLCRLLILANHTCLYDLCSKGILLLRGPLTLYLPISSQSLVQACTCASLT